MEIACFLSLAKKQIFTITTINISVRCFSHVSTGTWKHSSHVLISRLWGLRISLIGGEGMGYQRTKYNYSAVFQSRVQTWSPDRICGLNHKSSGKMTNILQSQRLKHGYSWEEIQNLSWVIKMSEQHKNEMFMVLQLSAQLHGFIEFWAQGSHAFLKCSDASAPYGPPQTYISSFLLHYIFLSDQQCWVQTSSAISAFLILLVVKFNLVSWRHSCLVASFS